MKEEGREMHLHPLIILLVCSLPCAPCSVAVYDASSEVTVRRHSLQRAVLPIDVHPVDSAAQPLRLTPRLVNAGGTVGSVEPVKRSPSAKELSVVSDEQSQPAEQKRLSSRKPSAVSKEESSSSDGEGGAMG